MLQLLFYLKLFLEDSAEKGFMATKPFHQCVGWDVNLLKTESKTFKFWQPIVFSFCLTARTLKAEHKMQLNGIDCNRMRAILCQMCQVQGTYS